MGGVNLLGRWGWGRGDAPARRGLAREMRPEPMARAAFSNVLSGMWPG